MGCIGPMGCPGVVYVDSGVEELDDTDAARDKIAPTMYGVPGMKVEVMSLNEQVPPPTPLLPP